MLFSGGVDERGEIEERVYSETHLSTWCIQIPL